MGFTYYNTKSVKVVPTTQEILASLTGGKKGAILNGFAKGTRVKILASSENINRAVVQHLYDKLDEMEEASRSLMRGEVVVTPEVIDPETGEITTPAVYNIPPANAGALLSAVQDAFSTDFTSGQVTAVLTKMVEYSKHNGDGDWAFYSTEVIK